MSTEMMKTRSTRALPFKVIQGMALALVLPRFLFASPGADSPSLKLSWQDCVERVSRLNPELQAARAGFAAAEAQVRGAWSGFFPQLSGSLGYSYSNSATASSTSGESGSVLYGGTSEGTGYYTASLNANQSLFSGLSDRARVDQARGNREASLQTLASARARISYDLKTAFTDVLTAQASIELSDEIIRRREANLKLVTLRFEGGRENKGSILLSKAYLAQARYDRAQAERSLDIARAQLGRVLGLDDVSSAESVENLRITGDVPVTEPPRQIRGPELRDLALRTPDFLTARAQEAVSSAALTSARAGFFPTLGLTASTSNGGPSWFPSNNRWSVGATLNYNFFTGGKDYYASRAAAENLKSSTLNQENAARLAVSRLSQALASYQNAALKLEVDQAFVDAASARARIAREKYNNGLLSFEDWDLIENDLISRQRALVQSRRDRVVAEAAWEQAQGTGVIQ